MLGCARPQWPPQGGLRKLLRMAGLRSAVRHRRPALGQAGRTLATSKDRRVDSSESRLITTQVGRDEAFVDLRRFADLSEADSFVRAMGD
jgi:hypothetical protein